MSEQQVEERCEEQDRAFHRGQLRIDVEHIQRLEAEHVDRMRQAYKFLADDREWALEEGLSEDEVNEHGTVRAKRETASPLKPERGQSAMDLRKAAAFACSVLHAEIMEQGKPFEHSAKLRYTAWKQLRVALLADALTASSELEDLRD